ncbi:hypothetical protein NDU88_006002 [Pleurodeles waltl]|uniref:Uncharacterized protein n=1 Tax=Pleurodeles waltl TaxID=8319 RepID=A0AAV7WWB1_PLEWA|nr:hypothetical protein NDU88_006002 [Pleurodeles waltl]
MLACPPPFYRILPVGTWCTIEEPPVSTGIQDQAPLIEETPTVGKQPRVLGKILTPRLTLGGLSTLTMQLYALCTQAQYLHYWLYLTPFQPHVAIETDQTAPWPLHTALYLPYKPPTAEINAEECLCWAWDSLRKCAKLTHLYALSIPISHNPQQPPILDEGIRVPTRERTIVTFPNLYPDGKFMPAFEGTDTSNPTLMEILLYHELRAACRAIHMTFPEAPPQLPALEPIAGLYNAILLPSYCTYRSGCRVTRN